jgi:hypothetical protein
MIRKHLLLEKPKPTVCKYHPICNILIYCSLKKNINRLNVTLFFLMKLKHHFFKNCHSSIRNNICCRSSVFIQDILLHVNFTVAAEQRILGLHLLIMAMLMTPYGTSVTRLDFVHALCHCVML